ncbi:MAG TPA: protein translocase SEC61 complex subunit gamma [Nanoarchaeota archaeon]|nr:protein translocase SEC61 complex subunit gamma [Candidatus Woesearchaeota archaeon]HIH15144.1 protein translocase SEC61 complex subunit gamma [Nanoarchaeota archaeon]HIH59411.1 protein translocase SEC61 complex subunit gamma [Nanoarchaeota archaeon]HII14315.1 protein translocase SEC61 complex subunit gamma [Nanoarchaeota archaeon]HIJ04598.1 protein translocase SEC61 complex subunit gamma [Nanoarchaeota archaeon]
MNQKLSEYWVKFKSFVKECKRVLQITKKPSKIEYKTLVKVTGIGILIIGALGFIITIGGTLLGI